MKHHFLAFGFAIMTIVSFGQDTVSYSQQLSFEKIDYSQYPMIFTKLKVVESSEPGDSGSFVLLINKDTVQTLQVDQGQTHQVLDTLSQDSVSYETEYNVRFTVVDSLALESYHKLFLTYKNLSTTAVMQIPLLLLEQHYINSTLKEVSQFVSKQDYEKAIELLNHRYSELPSKEFVSATNHVAEEYAILLTKTDHATPFSELTGLEKQISRSIHYNIDSVKVHVAQEYYIAVDVADSMHQERLMIATYLVRMEPENELYQYQLLWAEARIEHKEGNWWTAIDKYVRCNKLKEDTKVEIQIKELIEICFKNAFKEREWSQIYNYGKKYFSYINQSYSQRVIYGRSCFQMADYQRAIAQLEWITSNWNENPYLSWSEALGMLQTGYTHIFKLEEAVRLNQRIYRENGNPESLKLCLLNQRLLYMKPIIDILPLLTLETSDTKINDKLLDLRPIKMPEYIHSITVYRKNGNIVGKLYASGRSDPEVNQRLFTNRSWPAIQMELKRDIAWLINRTKKENYIVIQFDNSQLDNFERNILMEITKDAMNKAVWQDLFQYEEESGVKLMSQIITAGFEAMPGKVNINLISSYWAELMRDNHFAYMLFHPKQDNVITAQAYDPNKNDMNEADWQKSSKTTSFFLNRVNYDGSEVYDLANPVFCEDGWEGVLRLGVRKLY